MTSFLKTKWEAEDALKEIESRGWPKHKWNYWKNWDMTFLDFNGVDSILDIGCVTSMPLVIANVVGVKGLKAGIDPNPNYRGWTMPEGAVFAPGFAEVIPFPDNTFDMVTCLSVIEHDVNLMEFSEEMVRVLKPGGRFLVTFDFWPWPHIRGTLSWNELGNLREGLLVLGCELEPHDPRIEDKVIDKMFTFGALRGRKP